MQKFPAGFKADIVQRFLNEKAFEDFVRSYNAVKFVDRNDEPSDKQFEWAEYVRKNGLKAAIAKYKRVSKHRLKHAVSKVATYYWFTNK